MTQLPDRRPPEGSHLPERHLTPDQFEVVIRRAAELQARAADSASGEGITEAEVLRIGKELGLSGTHLVQALAEVRTGGATQTGLLDRAMGDAALQASRAVPGNADGVRHRLERYLVEREYLVVQRRFPDRTCYIPAQGIAATLGRASTGLARRAPLLGVTNLSVSVRPLEEGFCYVSLGTELAGRRAGYVAGAAALGGGGATAVSVALGIAVAPPAALLGIPVLAAAAAGARWLYGNQAERTRVALESLLDRLEHGELPAPARRRGAGA